MIPQTPAVPYTTIVVKTDETGDYQPYVWEVKGPTPDPAPAVNYIKGPYTTNRAQLRKIWKHTFKGRTFQDTQWRETLQACVQIKQHIESRLDRKGKFKAA